MIDVTKEGVVGNGNDESGKLQEIIDRAPEGSTIYFPASNLSNKEVEYGLLQPLLLTKSLHVAGESSAVSVLARGNNKLFRIEPSREDMVFSFENLELLSGSKAIEFSSSNNINFISRIQNCKFKSQTDTSIHSRMPGTFLRVLNCSFWENVYGVFVSSSQSESDFTVRDCDFVSSSHTAVRIEQNPGIPTSGTLYVESCHFKSNGTGVGLNNISGSTRKNRYEDNLTNVETSGSAQDWGIIHLNTTIPGAGSSRPGQQATIVQIGSASIGTAHTLNTDASFRVFKIPTDFVSDASFHVHWTKNGDADESGKVVKWKIEYTIWKGNTGELTSNTYSNVVEFEDTYEDSGTTTRIVYRTPNLAASGFVPSYYCSTKISAVTPDGTAMASEPVILSLDLMYRI